MTTRLQPAAELPFAPDLAAVSPGRSLRTMAAAALPPLAAGLGLLSLWWAICVIWQPPAFLLPAPPLVWQTLWSKPGFFAGNTAISLTEAGLGLLIGGGAAFLVGSLMAQLRWLERALMPLAILLKVTPIIVIAPLLLIWFGFGMAPKIIVAGLISFFPLLINTVAGLRSADSALDDVLSSIDASPWQRFRELRLPAALPYLFAALRVCVPLSLIGAVVAEWVGAEAGIGSVIMRAHSRLDMPELFAAVLCLALAGVVAMAILASLQRLVLHWAPETNGDRLQP